MIDITNIVTRISLICLLVFSCNPMFASGIGLSQSVSEVYQTQPSSTINNQDINSQSEPRLFVQLDEQPKLSNTDLPLMQFVMNQIQYPASAKAAKIQGRVVVSFVISELGEVEDIKVIRRVHSDLDVEAERVCSTLPDFVPAKINGKPVKVMCTIPFDFSLDAQSQPINHHKVGENGGNVDERIYSSVETMPRFLKLY